MTAHPFLARLQLDSGADTRAIRRAYARELKLIDQEAEPAAFQHLRECYERALAWAEHVAREDAPAATEAIVAVEAIVAADAPAGLDEPPLAQAPSAAPRRLAQEAAGAELLEAAPAAPGHAPSDPAEQARLVLAGLCAALPALLALPGDVRLDPWIETLRRAAADRRLEHLEARARFEGGVARLLASGWRPGHELLFPAAVRVFGWDADRRALERLQVDGTVLDAALDEQAAFLAQDVQARTQQREVLALLRKPEAPPEQTMWTRAGRLRMMAARFPHLVGVVAPQSAVRHWLERCPEPAFGPGASGQPKLDLDTQRATPGWRRWTWMIFALFWIIAHLAGSRGPNPDPPPLHPDFVRIMNEQGRRPPPVLPDLQPLTPQQFAAIRSRIDYRPARGTPDGVQEFRVEIYLDDDGNMIGVKRLKLPGDPAFGAAVEKAVHDSGPFPSGTARVFEVDVRIKVSHRGRTRVVESIPAPGGLT